MRKTSRRQSPVGRSRNLERTHLLQMVYLAARTFIGGKISSQSKTNQMLTSLAIKTGKHAH
jgi:hypothetical protein